MPLSRILEPWTPCIPQLAKSISYPPEHLQNSPTNMSWKRPCGHELLPLSRKRRAQRRLSDEIDILGVARDQLRKPFQYFSRHPSRTVCVCYRPRRIFPERMVNQYFGHGHGFPARSHHSICQIPPLVTVIHRRAKITNLAQGFRPYYTERPHIVRHPLGREGRARSSPDSVVCIGTTGPAGDETNFWGIAPRQLYRW